MHPDRQIVVNYCFTSVLLLYAKMLKETDTEETIGFFVFIIGDISIERGGGLLGPVWLRLWVEVNCF